MWNIHTHHAFIQFMDETTSQLNVLSKVFSITAGAVVGICCVLLMDRYSRKQTSLNANDEVIQELKQQIKNLEEQAFYQEQQIQEQQIQEQQIHSLSK